MDVSIERFDPQSASREEWARFHVYRRLQHEEENPGDPLVDDRTQETWMKEPDPQSDVIRFAAAKRDGAEEVVGWLYFSIHRKDSPSYETRKDAAQIAPWVLKPYRRQGIGRRLLAKAVELAREHNRSVIMGHCQDDDGKAFIKTIGAEIGLRTRESRLYMDRVDWEMVKKWAEEGPKRSPDTTLEFLGDRIPEDILEDYCAILTEVSNDAPRGDMKLGDIVITPATVRGWEDTIRKSGGMALDVITRESDGEISGLTAMGYFPDEKTIIHQFMTGVKGKHRGRGLGKWLKAAMLLRVREEFPQVEAVSTDNATTNAAMLSINERLGFEPYKEGIWAQIQVAALENYLAR
ncbi:MAG: GNAT family N-acetyltransferase [Thermoplasmata archaeon]